MSNIEEIIKSKKNNYDLIYNSSSCKDVKAELGTIEKDAAGLLGKFTKEQFRGERIFDILIKKDFTTILDIGPGRLEVVNKFIQNNKTVDISEFSDGLYFNDTGLSVSGINRCYFGDFNIVDFDRQYDAIWCSHVLEHQLNPNIFLKKINKILKEDGYLAIVVPPRKPFIVGGHVSIWNAGLLLYHLVLAGFDCSKAQILQYDYNIGIIIKKKSIELPKINYDVGDLLILKQYFPIELTTDSFNGDIMSLNV